MNILILGNGFDIAHGLPTKYTDFMTYMSFAELLYINKTNDLAHPSKETMEYQTDDKYESVDSSLRADLIGQYDENWLNNFPIELKKIIANKNLWYEYFSYKLSPDTDDNMPGGNWIDFEAEISDVIKKIESIKPVENMPAYQQGIPMNRFSYLSEDQKKYMLVDFMKKDQYIVTIDNRDAVITRLEGDLSDFINALEYYIKVINNFLIPYLLPDITQISFDRVVSFNYTDTYRRLYNKDFPESNIHFIHGKARTSSLNRKNSMDTASNLVLGADDTLPDAEESTNLCCLKFKKYFQRIYKQTGNDYKKFLDSAESKNEPVNSYFFGHSLAMTDGDVIQEIINRSDHVVIYYHNDTQHREEIVNLVAILGKDKMIDYAENKIVFQQQKVN